MHADRQVLDLFLRLLLSCYNHYRPMEIGNPYPHLYFLCQVYAERTHVWGLNTAHHTRPVNGCALRGVVPPPEDADSGQAACRPAPVRAQPCSS